MKSYLIRLGLLFCYCFPPLWCAAVQSYTPKVGDPVLEPWRWRYEESLSGLGVLCMAEAADGTLWFGNVGSIAHYDGVTVKTIRFDDELLSKIVHHREIPWANALLVLPNGNLLVLIGESLVLRTETEWSVIVQNVGESIFTAGMVRGDDGTVWLIVPGALWQISEDLKHVSVAMKSDEPNRLESFCLDPGGDLWVVERTGRLSSRLVHIPVEGGQPKPEWREFAIPFENERVESKICADQAGLIWYVNGSSQSGLNVFDPTCGEWITRQNVAEPEAYYSLMMSRDGSFWAGSEGMLLRSLPEGGEQLYSRDLLRLPMVPLSVFEAHNNRLWIIGRGGYVSSVDLGNSEWLTYNDLRFQCEAPDGVQWFLLKRLRVVSHNPHTGEWRQYRLDDGLIDEIDVLIRSSQGLIWIAGSHENRAAIAVFDGVRWTRFCHPEFARWIEPKAVFEAADGTVWFGGGGQQLWEVPNAGGALQYTVDGDGSARLLKHHAPPDFPYYVTSFSQTPDGLLWVGSTLIRCYDSTAALARLLPAIQGANAVDMALDQNQAMWIAKEHFGVCRWQGASYDVFTEKEGLASLFLSSLLVLDDGSILVSSDKGISRFDGKTWTKHAYPEWFAMSKRWSSLRKSADGSVWLNYVPNESREMYMAVSESNLFCTIRHRAEKDPPDTHVVDYLKSVSQPGNTHIIWSGHDLWSSTPQEELQFSWRLDGGEWSVFSPETSRTFLSLDSGMHTLEVRSRDRVFNVDPTPDRVEFTVIAPLWRQPWFLGMVSFFTGLILLLTWLLIRNRELYLLEKQAEHEAFLVKQQEEHEKNLIEQQAERERHLVEIDRLKTGFFTNISHELRTPLTVILGPLETMLKKEADPKKRSVLLMMARNAQRVASLITQLLDFRKLEEGKIAVETTYGDLVPVVKEVVDSLQPLAEDARLSCFLNSISACRGWFDVDKLQKILTNLIANSIKYTAAGGEVRVSFQVEDHHADCRMLRFVVEDTGVGIAPEHLEHVFDRFYRVSETSMAVGAGIGLNLTKELVDLLGGKIQAESPIHANTERPGTRFIVCLPIDPKEAPAGPAEKAEPHSVPAAENEIEHSTDESSRLVPVLPALSVKDGEPPLILVVEDDPDIRDFIVDGLAASFRVETAGDGDEALRIAKEQVPELVVTDVMMPVMDGVELCRELKASMETSHIPVVMLTAKTALENQLEGLKTGADDYITKPFHMELLLVRIKNLLESRRLLREQFRLEYSVSMPNVPVDIPESEFLKQALQVLEENHSNWEFTPDDFAAGMNMSRRTLQRKLLAVAGRTLMEFIHEFRTMRAAELLLSTTETISEISFKVGYDEPANFARLFKKYYKMTPSQYRTTHQTS